MEEIDVDPEAVAVELKVLVPGIWALHPNLGGTLGRVVTAMKKQQAQIQELKVRLKAETDGKGKTKRPPPSPA